MSSTRSIRLFSIRRPPSIEIIPRWTAFKRTLRPLRVIAHPSLRGPYSRHEFLDGLGEIQQHVTENEPLESRSVGLWQMEKLGYAYTRGDLSTLNDPDISLDLQPILHVGLGIAATEITTVETGAFSPQAIIDRIESQSHPKFRLFPYESIGCIWAVYANRLFKWIFKTVTKTEIPKAKLPPWQDFVDRFPTDTRRLLSHGYGRTLYFRDFQVERAIRSATQLPGVDTAAAVQGVAFAYLMLNYRDLHRVLEVGRNLPSPSVRDAFDRGLIAALALMDWTFPFFLVQLSPSSDRQARLIDEAEASVAEGRRLGRLPIFGLG